MAHIPEAELKRLRYQINGRSDLRTVRDPINRTEMRTNARDFTSVLTRYDYDTVVSASCLTPCSTPSALLPASTIAHRNISPASSPSGAM